MLFLVYEFTLTLLFYDANRIILTIKNLDNRL